MNKDRAIGAIILAASVIGLTVYTLLLYSFALLVLQITAFIAVAAVLVILAWIGWTMATTPPPAPLEPEPVTTETEVSSSTETKST